MKRLALMVLAVLTGTAAHAEFTKGSQTAAVFGGVGGSDTDYSYQPGEDRPVTGGGGAFGGQYLYYVKGSPALAFGVDLNSSMNGPRSDDDLLAGGYDTDQRLKSFVGLAVVRLSYPRGLFRPYLFGGMGGYSSTLRMTGTPQAPTTWPNAPATGTRVLVDKHGRSFALGFGLGFDLYFTESFFLGTELRSTWLAGLDTDDTFAIQNAGFTARDTNGVSQGNIFLRAGVTF